MGISRPLLVLLPFLASCAFSDERAEMDFARGKTDDALAGLTERWLAATDNLALEASLLASVALHAGDYRTAAEALSSAHAVMVGDADAIPPAVARLLRAGSRRLFQGAPHELVLNDIYRSLLALDEADPQSALEALSEALRADGHSPRRKTRSDLPAVYVLAALAALQVGEEAQAEEYLSCVRGLQPRLDADALRQINTVLWIDTGIGPQKIEGARGSSAPRFREYGPDIERIQIRVDGGQNHQSWPAFDLLHQATELGPISLQADPAAERRMDGGIMAFFNSSIRLLAVLAIPTDDVRHWHLAPARSFLWLGHLEPGAHTLRLEHFDQEGPVPTLDGSWPIPVAADRPTVLYVRTLPRHQ